MVATVDLNLSYLQLAYHRSCIVNIKTYQNYLIFYNILIQKKKKEHFTFEGTDVIYENDHNVDGPSVDQLDSAPSMNYNTKNRASNVSVR